MVRLALLFLLYSHAVHAISFENFLSSNTEQIEEAVASEKIKDLKVKSKNRDENLFKESIKKYREKNSNFSLNDYFYESTKFWYFIYTKYDSNHIVIHDKENLSIVYDVLDFNDLNKSNLNSFTKSSLQSQLALERTREIKKSLLRIKNKKALDKDIQIKKTIEPYIKNQKNFSKIIKNLSTNIRIQTGQKDNLMTGLNNFKLYSSEIKNYINLFNLPHELMMLPFLESSFNPDAVSKIGAKGAWQFMQSTARYFMKVNKYVDHRINPILASISALHLLKENKLILRTWDLAISAYNSGPKHYQKAKKVLKNKKAGLHDILERYKSPHIGFAAKNFYSEFLALVYGLSTSDEFKEIYDEHEKNIFIYVSKCSIRPSRYFKLLRKYPEIKRLNRHIKRKYFKKVFKPGLILLSPVKLNRKKYLLINEDKIKNTYPKKWKSLIKRNYNCSTI